MRQRDVFTAETQRQKPWWALKKSQDTAQQRGKGDEKETCSNMSVGFSLTWIIRWKKISVCIITTVCVISAVQMGSSQAAGCPNSIMLTQPTGYIRPSTACCCCRGSCAVFTSDLASVETHTRAHRYRLLAVLMLFLERESDTQTYISFLLLTFLLHPSIHSHPVCVCLCVWHLKFDSGFQWSLPHPGYTYKAYTYLHYDQLSARTCCRSFLLFIDRNAAQTVCRLKTEKWRTKGKGRKTHFS